MALGGHRKPSIDNTSNISNSSSHLENEIEGYGTNDDDPSGYDLYEENNTTPSVSKITYVRDNNYDYCGSYDINDTEDAEYNASYDFNDPLNLSGTISIDDDNNDNNINEYNAVYSDSDSEEISSEEIEKNETLDTEESSENTPLNNLLQNERSVGGVDWNSLFQEAIDLEDRTQRWKKLSTLGRDFVYTSKTYGKIIINEFSLTSEQKTIKPVDVGGRAGGMKYIAAGIFFKFALDMQNKNKTWMYGESSEPYDNGAIKAASNDMLGLLAYYNSNVDGLHYPLLCIVDYRGFRLLAMSILPIKKKSTLLYGSQNAGATAYNSNKDLSNKMKLVGEQLGLKEHKVQGRDKIEINGEKHSQPIIKICAPIDIEGHLGTDNKFYVLDFGRVFPPEVPSHPCREIFYNLLRPEFVRQYETPLSSDAFSNFGSIDSAIHNKELHNATMFLHKQVIPKFIKETLEPLENLFVDRITERIHRAGINCRHLGRIRSQIDPLKPNILRAILSEITARTIKSILKLLQRQYTRGVTDDATKQEPYKRIAFKILKSLFSPLNEQLKGLELTNNIAIMEDLDINDITLDYFKKKSFWCVDIKYIIQDQFSKTFTDDELIDGYDIRKMVDMSTTVTRICNLSGIRLRDNLLEDYSLHPDSFKFMKFDLKKLTVRARHLNVIDEAEGNLLFKEALTQTSAYSGIWKATHEKFERAVSSNTNSFKTFLQWGKVFYHQSFLLSTDDLKKHSPSHLLMKRQEIFRILDQAMEKFTFASEIKDSWECDIYKGLIHIENGVINHIHTNIATVSRIAESQWQINLACDTFSNAFEKSAESFTFLTDLAEKTYKEAIKFNMSSQIHLYLLRAFYILYAGLKASIVIPDTNHFFNAGFYLIEYCKRGGKDPGRHLAGAAASMIESALLRYPAIASDNAVFQLDQSSRYLPELSSEQYNISRPAHIYSITNDDVLSPWCHLVKTVELRPAPTLLHFMPFTVHNPSEEDISFHTGQIFKVLGQFKASSNLHTLSLTSNSFILCNSACNKFLLTKIELGIPINAQLDSIPKIITVTGVNHLSKVTKKSGNEICSTKPKVGDNEFIVEHRKPSRYLIVEFDVSSEYALTYLSFYGVQIDPNAVKEVETVDSNKYIPRPVKWISSTDDNIVVHENLASFIAKKRLIKKTLRKSSKQIKVHTIRASPAFTLRWNTSGKSEKQFSKTRPILIIIDPAIGSLLSREILKVVRAEFSSTFSSGSSIKIKPFKTALSMKEWLTTQDLSRKSYAENLIVGGFRICVVLRGAINEKDGLQILEFLQAHTIWKNIPLLVYSSTPKSLCNLPSKYDLAWETTKRSVAIDFMAMKLASLSYNFDPHGEFSQKTADLLTESQKRISRSSRIRHSALQSHKSKELIRTISNQILEAPGKEFGPFLYFEITFVADTKEQTSSFCVGLSPKRFFENQYPGSSPGSFGFHSSGVLYTGDRNPYKFRDLVREGYSFGDVIGCGYNQQRQEIYWTKNGKYLGVAERGRSQLPKTSKSLFATVSVMNYFGKVEANFGQTPFKFNPSHLQRIFEHASAVPEQIGYPSIHPYTKKLFSKEHINYFLPILASVGRFSASFQLLLRAYTSFTDDFNIVDCSQYHFPTPYSLDTMKIGDNVICAIGQILPRSTYGLNLCKCDGLSELFFEKVPNFERMHMLNLSRIPSLSDNSAKALQQKCRLLRYLRVWEHITDTALLEIPKFENLRTLDLTECKTITCRGFCTIIKKLAPNLTGLIIDECTELTDESLNTLARSGNQLEKLSMERTAFSEIAVINLIKNSPNLLSLGIGGWGVRTNPFSDKVAETISQCLSKRLRGLSIYRSNISDSGLVQLVNSCLLLEEINIGNMSHISDNAIAFFSKLSHLSRLELMSSGITDQTLLKITKNCKLTELSIHRCYELTPRGIENAFKYLSECKFLCLKESYTDDNTLKKTINNMTSIKCIDVRRTNLSASFIQELRRKTTVYDSGSYGDLDGRLYTMWEQPNSRVVNIHKRKRSR